MWVEFHQTKKGLPVGMCLLDEFDGAFGDVVVDGFHALFGQRAGVFDDLFADAAKAWLNGGIIHIGGFAVHDATRAKAFAECRIFGIVRILRLFLGVEMVEVAVELIKAVNGGQELVAVAQVVLAELTGDVALRLEQFGNGRIFGLQAEIGAGQADLGQTGADRVLTGDEGGAAGGAALLGVVVGEFDAFFGDAVDVGRAIAHRAAIVVADVVPADVIAPEDENVGFSVWHS